MRETHFKSKFFPNEQLRGDELPEMILCRNPDKNQAQKETLTPDSVNINKQK